MEKFSLPVGIIITNENVNKEWQCWYTVLYNELNLSPHYNKHILHQYHAVDFITQLECYSFILIDCL